MAQKRPNNDDILPPEQGTQAVTETEVSEPQKEANTQSSGSARTRGSKQQSRSAESREATARPAQWTPASLLPEPEPREGVKYRWVRKTIFGNDDPTNFSRKVREGWEPCRIEDHPELRLHVDRDAVDSGLVEVGGLILCQMPVEMVEQRNQYYGRKTDAQMESVDNNLMKENDPRMPLFNNRQSSVSFGRGGSS